MTYWPLDPTLLLPVARTLPRRMLVTPFEDGPPAVRRRFLGAPGAMSGSIRITGTDLATLLAWGEGALSDWTLPFQWRDPMDATFREFQFASEPGPLALEATGDAGDPTRTIWALPVSLWVIA